MDDRQFLCTVTSERDAAIACLLYGGEAVDNGDGTWDIYQLAEEEDEPCSQ